MKFRRVRGSAPINGDQLRDAAVARAFTSGIAAKTITVAAGFAAVAFAVRQLGDSQYGIVVALTGAAGVLGFLDLGIGNALIGLLARAHAAKDTGKLRSLLASAFVFLSGMGLIALVTSVVVIWLIPPSYLLTAEGADGTSVRIAMTVFAVGVAFAIPFSLGSKLALGLQMGHQNNLVSIASGVSMLALALIGTFAGGGLVFYMAVFALVPTLANAVQTVVLLTSRKVGLQPDFHAMNRRQVLELLPAGIPFSVMAIASALSYQADALIVAYFVSAAAAAGYGLLLRVFTGATVFFTAGLQQFWASTSHALAEGRLEWVRRTFARVLAATMGAYLLGTVVLLVFGRWLIELWSGGEVAVGQDLILAFALWNLYNFAMTQFSFLLNGAGIVKLQAIAATCMTVVNVPLSIILTLKWGAVGPLYGSLISHALCVGVPTVVMSLRLLNGRWIPPVATSEVAIRVEGAEV